MFRRRPYLDRSIARRRPGYSLIELVVVVLICSILAAAAIPKYSGALFQFRLDAASKRVAADLAFAQRQAMLRSASQTIQFNTAANKTLASRNTYAMSGVQYVNSAATGTVVNLAQDPYSITITSANFNTETFVTFDRYGVANSSGSVVLQAGGYQKTVSLNAATGRITIQ